MQKDVSDKTALMEIMYLRKVLPKCKGKSLTLKIGHISFDGYVRIGKVMIAFNIYGLSKPNI